MKDLVNMPTEEFPLNWKKYRRLMDDIQNAARGFDELENLGWPRGQEIHSRLMDVHHALWQAWNLIQDSERELLAHAAPAKPKG